MVGIVEDVKEMMKEKKKLSGRSQDEGSNVHA